MQSANRRRVLREHFGIVTKNNQLVVALAGNPNVGKSTVFNALTGLRQYTGNWPGKTVDNAQGTYSYNSMDFLIIDLPGTYSILARTEEEEVARDFICFGHPDVTVVILDATALERSLNIALQVLEITPNIVVCINLIDEAKKQKIEIDLPALEKALGVPVVATAARQSIGIDNLKEKIFRVATGLIKTNPIRIKYSKEIEEAVQQLLPIIDRLGISKILDPYWVALRLLDGDDKFIENIALHLDFQYQSGFLREVELAL